MWELEYEEGWALKNWCFWTVVLEKTLESPLDCKDIKPVNPKGNQPWILIGSTDDEAEVPLLWPLDVKSQHIGKDLDVGKDWRWEKETVEGEMVEWHHWFNGHEFEQTLRDSEGQGSLACSPWNLKELDMTEQLNNNSSYEFVSAQHISYLSKTGNMPWFFMKHINSNTLFSQSI